MRRRFILWGVIAGVMLGGSSVLGTVVKAVIRPREYDYSRIYAPASVRAAPITVRQGLVNARPAEFGPPAPPNAGDVLTFQSVFDGVAQTAGNRNVWNIAQYFDFDGMAEELARLGAYRAVGRVPTDRSVADDAQTFQNAVSALLNRPDTPFGFDRSQVISVAWAKNAPDVLVLARHYTRGGEQTLYRRWWMRPMSGPGGWAGWRVYDFDEPGTRLRFTVVHAGVMADGTAPAAGAAGPAVFLNTENGLILVGSEDDHGVAAVRAALAAADEGDRATAAAKLAEARRWKMLPPLDAVREVAEARVLLLDGRPAVALQRLNSAAARWADNPAADLARAAAFNDLKRPADALSAVNRYRAAAGNDPQAVREEARAKAGRGDRAGGVAALRAGLKEFPGAVPLLAEWYALAPADKRGEAGELAANAPDPVVALTNLLRRIGPGDASGDGAAAVVAGYREIRPGEPVGIVAAAAATLRKGPAAAAGLLREGLAGLPDDERRVAALREFARAAVAADRVGEAYEAAVGAGAESGVFRPLADAALAAVSDRGPKSMKPRADRLRGVLTAYAAKNPTDPWPDYYAGELALLAGDPATAERRFAAGMAKLPQPDPRENRATVPPGAADPVTDPRERDWEAFRSRRTVCLFKLGEWRRAYDELSPKADTFDQLARLLADAGDAAGLAALVAAHEAAEPDDAGLFPWRVETYFQQRDYRAVVAACLEAAGPSPAANDSLLPRVADRWVRSLVRLGRTAEAENLTLAVGHDAPGVTLRAVVAAATGDVTGTERHVRELLRLGRSWSDVAADPDLGQLLRTDKFAALRKELAAPAR